MAAKTVFIQIAVIFLAVSCRVVEGVTNLDCNQDFYACKNRFQTSDNEDKCEDYHELAMCVQAVQDRDVCNSIESQIRDEFQAIASRFENCSPTSYGNAAKGHHGTALSLPMATVFLALLRHHNCC